jgi:hypothetical protein
MVTMTKPLDLTAIDRVAGAGDPKDGVHVSRRFPPQVYAELHSSRTQTAVLDYDPCTKAPAESQFSATRCA